MSDGFMMALAVAAICGGSAGFERQIQNGNHRGATFETIVIIAGIALLAIGIDGFKS